MFNYEDIDSNDDMDGKSNAAEVEPPAPAPVIEMQIDYDDSVQNPEALPGSSLVSFAFIRLMAQFFNPCTKLLEQFDTCSPNHDQYFTEFMKQAKLLFDTVYWQLNPPEAADEEEAPEPVAPHAHKRKWDAFLKDVPPPPPKSNRRDMRPSEDPDGEFVRWILLKFDDKETSYEYWGKNQQSWPFMRLLCRIFQYIPAATVETERHFRHVRQFCEAMGFDLGIETLSNLHSIAYDTKRESASVVTSKPSKAKQPFWNR